MCKSFAGSDQSLMTSLGKHHMQIFLDLQFKSFSRQPLNEETTVSEMLKNLKYKYTAVNDQTRGSSAKPAPTTLQGYSKPNEGKPNTGLKTARES